MNQNNYTTRIAAIALLVSVLFGSFCSIGCQTNINGQTLPDGHYLDDDLYYQTHGPEFPFSREAAFQEKQKAERAEQIQQNQQNAY
ncbi:MAG: hypothetical protein LBQ54_13725 [Planctomycetaceae bacterium]|jgi:hypothetical protein|nr:hypothetical protein [Planctomycetaceae bacterium]